MPETKSVPITVAEHDNVTEPPTKRVLLYGWDGSAKTRIKTAADGTLATSATITASAQPIRDGSNSSIYATVASYASANPLIVRLSDTTGAYVAAGAGTQYTSGASLALATGGVSMGLDTANSVVKQVHVDSAGDLQVDVVTAPITTVVATASSFFVAPHTVYATGASFFATAVQSTPGALIATVVGTSSSLNANVSGTVTAVATASSFFVAPHTVYATAASFFATASQTGAWSVQNVSPSSLYATVVGSFSSLNANVTGSSVTVTLVGTAGIMNTMTTGASFNVQAMTTGASFFANVKNASPSSLFATVVASAASFNATVSGTAAVYGTSSSLRVHPEASATGGYSNFTTASLTNTPILVNGAASTMGGYFLTNTNASYVYVKMWDKVSASSVSITSASYIAPNLILGLPANAGANVLDAVGAAFANGIVINVNTEATTGSAPSNQCVATVWYK